EHRGDQGKALLLLCCWHVCFVTLLYGSGVNKKPPLAPPLRCKGGGLERQLLFQALPLAARSASALPDSPPCRIAGRGSWRGFLHNPVHPVNPVNVSCFFVGAAAGRDFLEPDSKLSPE